MSLVAPLFEQAKVRREPSRRVRHRPLRRVADVDEAQGHGHRSVLGRRLHRRRRTRRSSVPGCGARRVQEDRREGQQDRAAPCCTATRSTARGTSSCCATARRSRTSASNLLFGQAHVGDSASRGRGQRREPAGHSRDLRLQRRVQGRHRARRSRRRSCSRSTTCARTPRRPRRAVRARASSSNCSRTRSAATIPRRPRKKPMCPCTDAHARGGAHDDRAREAEDASRPSWSSSSGRRRTAATSAAPR